MPIGAKRDVPIASYNRPEVAHRHNRKEDELDPRDCEGVVYYLPTPKSPHGVDVDPTGEYIVAGGKLATVIPVHSFTKLAKAIEAKQSIRRSTASALLQLPGQTADLKVTLAPGKYYFQCDPHAALGMKGHLKRGSESKCIVRMLGVRSNDAFRL